MSYKEPYDMDIKELWENTKLVRNYKGADCSFLIGKHYLSWSRYNKLILHELKLIPISKISKTSEPLKDEKPIYKDLNTTPPPVDVTLLSDGTYRLYNGHRRLKSAIVKGEKYIFAEICSKYKPVKVKVKTKDISR